MKKVKNVNITKPRTDGDFVPPDGGWGWLIIIAAGFSNLSVLPSYQQFGLLFRDRFASLGISSTQMTTVINMHSACTSCIGLANGPMFKKFTYRQVALAGSIMVFVALIMATFSNSFITYLISLSFLYGSGYGISSSANALALNTYWKKRRRIATGISWTLTGLGPMIWPPLITFMFAYLGEQGTIFIITGFSLHALACSLLLQPVEWHTKSVDDLETQQKACIEGNKNEETKNSRNRLSILRNLSEISSQYIYNEDDLENTGYEITDPGVPMMIRSNDGYYSKSRESKSKVSSREGSNRPSRLNSKKPSMNNLTDIRSRKTSFDQIYINNDSKKNSSSNLGSLANDKDIVKVKRQNTELILESEIEDCPTLKAPQDLKAEEKAALDTIDPEQMKLLHSGKIVTGISAKPLKTDESSEICMQNNKNKISIKKNDRDERKYLKNNHSNQSLKLKSRQKPNNFNYETDVLKQASIKLEEYLKEKEPLTKYEKIKQMINSSDDDYEDDDDDGNVHSDINQIDDENETNLTLCQKVSLFFDLDLLKDYTFVNLMIGLTFATFAELNFSVLTPFILGDFGVPKHQVAIYMSTLAAFDLSIRFCVPFIAGKIGWENSTFFLFGIIVMAAGRIILSINQDFRTLMLVAVVIGIGKGLRTVFMALVIPTYVPLHKLPGASGIQLMTAGIVYLVLGPLVVLSINQDFRTLMLVAVVIGIGKGLRTVFMALVIPTYVPLHKLPGASGIQLMTAGIVYLVLGPLVGSMKDKYSPAIILHFLNIFTLIVTVSWTVEKYYQSKKDAKEEIKLKNEKVTA